MKLNEYSLIFLTDDNEIGTRYQQRNQFVLTKRESDLMPEQVKIMNETGYRKLVFSKESLNRLDDYKIPNEVKVDVLRSLPNRTDSIQLEETMLFKYKKTDTEIQVVFYTLIKDSNGGNLHCRYSKIDLLTGESFPPINEWSPNFNNLDKMEGSEILSDYLRDLWTTFMVTITYLELTDVTLNIVQGGQKRGDIMKNNVIKNQTKHSVIQVNSNWNTKLIRINSFGVRGHWRLQPHGKGKKQYKWIFIEPYEKGIMKRSPQKELVN